MTHHHFCCFRKFKEILFCLLYFLHSSNLCINYDILFCCFSYVFLFYNLIYERYAHLFLAKNLPTMMAKNYKIYCKLIFNEPKTRISFSFLFGICFVCHFQQNKKLENIASKKAKGILFVVGIRNFEEF